MTPKAILRFALKNSNLTGNMNVEVYTTSNGWNEDTVEHSICTGGGSQRSWSFAPTGFRCWQCRQHLVRSGRDGERFNLYRQISDQTIPFPSSLYS